MLPKRKSRKDEKQKPEAKESRAALKLGTVVSNKMQKTVVVAVENRVLHPTYLKYVKRTSKFLAHNEASDLNIGDKVVIQESRPLSKRKRWNVKEVISRAS